MTAPDLVPELLVTDISRSLELWCDLCGFEVAYGQPDGYLLRFQSSTGHRPVAAPGTVQVVDSPGSGDDTIVDVVEQLAETDGSIVVATADRELRSRVAALGARTVGPRAVRPERAGPPEVSGR